MENPLPQPPLLQAQEGTLDGQDGACDGFFSEAGQAPSRDRKTKSLAAHLKATQNRHVVGHWGWRQAGTGRQAGRQARTLGWVGMGACQGQKARKVCIVLVGAV